MTGDLQERLRNLITQHCDTLRKEAADIGTVLERWPDDEVPDPVMLRRARGAAHKLKGSSGTIGFAAVSASAAELEALLDEAAASPAAARRDPILEHNRALQDAVSTLRPEQSGLYDRLP